MTPDGLNGPFEMLVHCLELVERNDKFRIKCYGEPQLGKRGLYPQTSRRGSAKQGTVQQMTNFIAYADGTNDLISISDLTGVPVQELYPIVDKLRETDLIEVVPRG